MKIDKWFLLEENNSTTDSNRLMLRMVTSYSIFLLVILVMGIYLYFSTSKNIRTSFLHQNKAMLINSINAVDKDFDIMEVFCRQLLQDNTFRRLAAREEADLYFLSDGFSVKKELAANMYPEILLPINEYYIHLENTNYLLSSSHFVDQSLFYSGTRLYPAELYEDWVSYLENPEYFNTFLSLDNYSIAPNVHYYLYVIGLNQLSNRNAPASACFIIDAAKLGSLFSGIDLHNSGFLMITDEENQLLYMKSAAADPYDRAAYNPELITQLTYHNNYADLVMEGEPMTVIHQQSASSRWNYYLVQPASAYVQTFHSYQKMFLLILAFALVIGIWLVLFFSRRNVRPIVRLGQELHEAVETSNQLQEVVDKQKPIIRNSYVRQLMLGTVASPNEMHYIREYLNLKEESLCFNVLYGVIYNNESERMIVEELSDSEKPFPTVINAMQEYLGEPLLRYSPTDRTYAILLVCQKEEEDSFIMKMQEIVLKLHEYLLDEHSIWFFAGIGRNTDSLMNVWEAYQQAQEAINYATKNYFFLPYEIIKKDSNIFYYPPELSTKLIHFITSGNKAQVLELFNLIHQENIEERSLPVHLLKYLMSDIRNTLLKARFEAPSETDNSILDALDAKFDQHLSFKLCEDIAISLCDIFQVEHEDTSLASTIEKYIVEHYRDPSLCLNKISDEFQISESYFSHMFKEKTGANFSVYLENIRMKEAAKLVRETTTNLSELYVLVGYNNITTFRRAFKKTYGVTPSSMRDTTPGKK